MKKKLILTIELWLTLIAGLAFFFVPLYLGEKADEAPKGKEYPMSAVVVELDAERDVVVIEDFNGNLWEFESIEDWMVGDICACIMNDMGTEIIYDDVIVTTKYCGYYR